ncbi:MAG: DUF4198 domain-containing protein [Desulfovibrio sp.]|jgi:cobalt/nickel transport protein|nr:DUF4198 domain-containing protein [Desulfovibrio sp.]
MPRILLVLAFLLILTASQAHAHFGMAVPDTSTVTDSKQKAVGVRIAFAHPMEGEGMDMERPKAFFLAKGSAREDLAKTLSPDTFLDHKAWKATVPLHRPGIGYLVVEPEPYFESAEDTYIIHYTKTPLAIFGEEDGWEEPLGLKAEIVPLTRPFGNYAGNVFTGQVLLDGKPAANVTVEVEHYNTSGLKAPNEYFVTQAVRTDERGIFSYGIPWAGWWGFAGLCSDKSTLDHKGTPKPVELGAVLWMEFLPPLKARQGK